jgi:SP family general alpha glucoside:H+ symporter-like MFS transporter
MVMSYGLTPQTWFRLPEPKGRSYGELDLLFEQKVPARKFKTTQVNEFQEASSTQVGGAFVH